MDMLKANDRKLHNPECRTSRTEAAENDIDLLALQQLQSCESPVLRTAAHTSGDDTEHNQRN